MTVADQTVLFQLALLGCVDGIGRRTLRKILKYRTEQHWSWDDIWVPTTAVAAFLALPPKTVVAIQKADKEQLSLAFSKAMVKHPFRLMGTESKEYPPLLKESDDPPPVLMVKGAILAWPEDSLPIAIVGTRKMTAYGRTATEKIASELADLGAITVSGLMYGVDSVAHLAAVRAGGKTIAVLGYGFDHCYPVEHQPVLDELLATGATFISEYPPWKIAKHGNFPARNSIVAAMSAAVVVTEAAVKSGSMITVQFAVDEGRAVCAVPGPITNPYCEGTKWLINEGATLVSSGSEVLEQIYRPNAPKPHLTTKSNNRTKSTSGTKTAPPFKRNWSFVSPAGKQILNLLLNAPADLDTMIQQLRLDQQVLLTALTQLEMEMLIQRDGSFWSLS